MTAEQFIKDYTRTASNELIAVEDINGKKIISYHEWLTPEQALRAVEIAKDAFIEKAEKFLKSYRRETPDGIGYIAGIIDNKTIEDFKKYMEE